MEKLLSDIMNKINTIADKINKIDEDIETYGHRLERLEKMDSIEHRVTVNQIDLTDIKAIVEKVADFQKAELIDLSRMLNNHLHTVPLKEELNFIHKRLDVQLTKIAKNEEAILIVGNRD